MQASFVQKQQLGVKMNPQVYQSIKLMEMPVAELREKIAEEVERNPALEVLEDRSTVSLDESENESSRREIEEYFETSSDSGFIKTDSNAAGADSHHRFIEGVLSQPETLQEHLLWQLQLEPVDDEVRAIAATLIQNLDDDGFHKEPPETLFPVPPPRMKEAMRLVQTLDPTGCCTADYLESLRVQIAQKRENTACLECSLEHLALFERGKFSEAAKKMKCGQKEALDCYETIKKMLPFPGRSFNAGDVRYVIPEVMVARDGDDFVIVINNEIIPVLGINPFFLKLDSDENGERSGKRRNAGTEASGGAERDFARKNIKEAHTFIHSIAMRRQTLKLVSRAILDFQRPFFTDGPRSLVPLTLADIAGALGVHETTVSRAANGKYMQTEWGIFELRYFFTNSISGAGSSGSQFSKGGVKAVIRDLIGADNKRLSDLEIAELLAKRGISIARRTVAKYRKELDLGSSYTR